jgi:hypothetical protein
VLETSNTLLAGRGQRHLNTIPLLHAARSGSVETYLYVLAQQQGDVSMVSERLMEKAYRSGSRELVALLEGWCINTNPGWLLKVVASENYLMVREFLDEYGADVSNIDLCLIAGETVSAKYNPYIAKLCASYI